MQDAAIREHTERLSAAAQAARQLVRKQDTVLKERVEQVSSLVLPGGKGRRKSLFAMLICRQLLLQGYNESRQDCTL